MQSKFTKISLKDT